MNDSQTIGIIGGGQLGRMLTLAALPLGFKVVVVDPTPNAPAAQVGAEQIVADLYDTKALKTLAEQADCLTIEIEHLDAATLDAIAASGKPVHPAPQTIRLIQDKLAQKEFLAKAGIPVAPYRGITNLASAEQAWRDYKGQMIVKTRFGAYDGRGNMVIKKPADLKRALKLFAGRPLYAEKLVPFQMELAVMVAKSRVGQIKTYPVVQTIHRRNICVEVLAPAPIDNKVRAQAERMVQKVASLLDGAGVFGVELFLTGDNKVLVNEIAPRVHNSGHYTLEANRTSQFEQHIRAVSGLPLGETDLVVPAAVMVNILGERDGPTRLSGLEGALALPRTSVHLYGKGPTKVDRKMGHITATGQNLAQARQRARRARKLIDI